MTDGSAARSNGAPSSSTAVSRALNASLRSALCAQIGKAKNQTLSFLREHLSQRDASDEQKMKVEMRGQNKLSQDAKWAYSQRTVGSICRLDHYAVAGNNELITALVRYMVVHGRESCS